MSPNSRPTFPGEVQGGYKDRKARAHNRRRRAWYLRPAPSPFSARCYSLRSEGHRRGPRRGRSAVEGRKERAVPLGSRSFASLWGRGWKYPLIVGKMLGRTNDLREFWPQAPQSRGGLARPGEGENDGTPDGRQAIREPGRPPESVIASSRAHLGSRPDNSEPALPSPGLFNPYAAHVDADPEFDAPVRGAGYWGKIAGRDVSLILHRRAAGPLRVYASVGQIIGVRAIPAVSTIFAALGPPLLRSPTPCAAIRGRPGAYRRSLRRRPGSAAASGSAGRQRDD